MAEAEATAGYRLEATHGVRELWWLGGRLSIKSYAAQTDGRMSQIETNEPRGGGPPRHIHTREDETFCVLEGSVTAYLNGDRIDLEEGDYCFAPKGIEHVYVVTSDRARLLVTLAPGGFEKFFTELGLPVVDGEPEPDPADSTPAPPVMVERCASYGVQVTGPPLGQQ